MNVELPALYDPPDIIPVPEKASTFFSTAFRFLHTSHCFPHTGSSSPKYLMWTFLNPVLYKLVELSSHLLNIACRHVAPSQ